MVNDPILQTNKPLYIELGSGILYNICKKVQRPLKVITIKFGDVYIPQGVVVPTINKEIAYNFQPKKLSIGYFLTGGDLYVTVFENSLMEHGNY